MGQGFFVMFFGRGKDFFKELFANISSPVPSINNVQSLTVHFPEQATNSFLSWLINILSQTSKYCVNSLFFSSRDLGNSKF